MEQLAFVSGFWGLSPPGPHRGSAPGPRWETSVTQTASFVPPHPLANSWLRPWRGMSVAKHDGLAFLCILSYIVAVWIELLEFFYENAINKQFSSKLTYVRMSSLQLYQTTMCPVMHCASSVQYIKVPGRYSVDRALTVIERVRWRNREDCQTQTHLTSTVCSNCRRSSNCQRSTL